MGLALSVVPQLGRKWWIFPNGIWLDRQGGAAPSGAAFSHPLRGSLGSLGTGRVGA